MNVKFLNIVMSLFYIHRGLSLSEIFYLSIIWSVVGLITEVPSSYLADHWGRKKTILLGIASGLAYWLFFLYADSFLLFALGIACYAASWAMFTGTDEALLYDTAKELKEEKSQGLKQLGFYFASRRVFKIISVVAAALIASTLSESQFQILILIDVVAVSLASLFAFRLVEANHVMDVESVESGVLIDAWHLLKTSPDIFRALLHRTFPMIGSIVMFHIFQYFFVEEVGISVIALSIGWASMHVVNVLIQTVVIHRLKKPAEYYLNWLVICGAASISLFLLCFYLLPIPYLLYTLFLSVHVFLTIRYPFYSSYINARSKSYNRATTLSLTNFLKNVLDIPVLFLMASLITYDTLAPFYLAFVLIFGTVLCVRLSPTNTQKTVVQHG